MLRLGGELGDGTFVNFLPLSAAEHVVARVREGERPGASRRRSSAASSASPATGSTWRASCSPPTATVPVYEAFFRGLGWGEAIDPMVAGLARRRPQGWRSSTVPEELCARSSSSATRTRCASGCDEFAARGITTLVLTPIARRSTADLIDALAP